MATKTVTVVRIYLREGEHLLADLLKFLQDDQRVSGVSVFRGIAGFSADKIMHTSSLLDLSMDLPLIVEFYEEPAGIETVLNKIPAMLTISHVVSWSAQLHLRDK